MNSVIAQMDAVDLNSRRDDDDDEDDDDLDPNANGWGSPKDRRECYAQGDPKNHPSTLLSDNISRPLSSDSALTSPSSSSGSVNGLPLSKLDSDKATALARAALRNRSTELGHTTGETIPLFISNSIWGPGKANSPVSTIDGSYSVATNLTLSISNSNEKEVKESKLPLNSLGNITRRPLTCPGCQMDFKTFSGFVLHIENRLCMSLICHEIEDRLNAFAAQFFNALASSGRV